MSKAKGMLHEFKDGGGSNRKSGDGYTKPGSQEDYQILVELNVGKGLALEKVTLVFIYSISLTIVVICFAITVG